VAILKLDKPASDLDPVQAELCRRLIATIILMENTFPPYLDLAQSMPPIRPLPQLYSEDEFDIVKSSAFATPSHSLTPSPCVTQEILVLSEIYYKTCQLFRTSDTHQFAPIQRQLSDWHTSLHPSLAFTQANLETHHQKFTLRSFMYMHLLYAYIWQLVLFESLDWKELTLSGSLDADNSTTSMIYGHASAMASIIQQSWSLAPVDLHNACFGQMVKTAQVILTHWLLTATDPRAITSIQSQLLVLRDCLIRVKAHCRLFNWVVGSYSSYI
jgi:hypothetical protein